jgi:hypothetical protein
VTQTGLDAMHAEGQGVWRIGLHHPKSLPESDALAGSVRALYERSAKTKCLTCDANFARGRVAGIATLCADVPDPQHWMVSAICGACFGRLDIRHAIRSTLEHGLGVKIRRIDIGAPGRA